MSEEQRVSTETVDNAFKALMRQSSRVELFRSLLVYSVLASCSLSWKNAFAVLKLKSDNFPTVTCVCGQQGWFNKKNNYPGPLGWASCTSGWAPACQASVQGYYTSSVVQCEHFSSFSSQSLRLMEKI